MALGAGSGLMRGSDQLIGMEVLNRSMDACASC
jgi:hypothetical protein